MLMMESLMLKKPFESPCRVAYKFPLDSLHDNMWRAFMAECPSLPSLGGDEQKLVDIFITDAEWETISVWAGHGVSLDIVCSFAGDEDFGPRDYDGKRGNVVAGIIQLLGCESSFTLP